jgi:hypothetical protein
MCEGRGLHLFYRELHHRELHHRYGVSSRSFGPTPRRCCRRSGQFLEPTCEFLQRELVLGAGAVARAARAAQAEFVSAPHPKAVDGRH